MSTILHVRCHMSGVTCQVSHVTCHLSFVAFFSLWSVCYQQGLLCLVFRFVGNKNMFIPNIYLSSGPILVIKKSKFMKISAHAEAAPCAHFQKLDVGINYFFSYLNFDIFIWVTWLVLHG